MCDALHYLLDNIFIRFGSKLYRQIVGIPMGTNCAPLVADLFLFCYERDFMLSLSDNNQSDIIEAFNSTSRYLDDLLNIDNPYFEQMVGQIYPTELQLNKANSSDTEAPFLDLNLSITNGIVSSKIYDKRDDFNFEIVNFPLLDGDIPRSPSYGVYISQLIRFARVCSNVDDFNNRNVFLTAKLLKQGNRYHKIRKAFSKFYHRHSEFIVKYNIGLKTLLQQGISEPIFYGDFTLILPLCCLFNPERHELARGIYIIREVYIAMFVIRIIQLTIAFNHSYHTCKFDIDWVLLKISKINANFDIIAACSSFPSLLLLPFASCS